MARFRLARPAQIDLANILATSAERWGADGRQRYAAVLADAMRHVADEPEGPLTKKRTELRSVSTASTSDRRAVLLTLRRSGDRFTFSTPVRRFVTPIELGSTGRTRIFHVHHKPLYAAIGEPDNRNRRRVTVDRTIERLMILDGVLADRSVTWLGSEREKRRYFKQHLGDHLRNDEYPRLVFGKTPSDRALLPGQGPHRLRRRSPPTRVHVCRTQSFTDGLPCVHPAASRVAQRVGLLDHSSLVPEAAGKVDRGVQARRLRARSLFELRAGLQTNNTKSRGGGSS